MPSRMAQIQRCSTATALPNVWRSEGRFSSIQSKAAGEIGRKRNIEPWFSQRKSGVGELPEATNESLCEDIVPPVKRRCLRKFWERTNGGFCPVEGRIPSFRRLAPWPCLWLGCWTAKIAVTLDTRKIYHSTSSCPTGISSSHLFPADLGDLC
jgi:hypothetical protein